MLSRCNSRPHNRYQRYGARGIKVCDEWKTFENFYSWASRNGYKKTLTIDRIGNDGDYTLENCRFVDYQTNNRNRNNNRNITAFNKTQCLNAWADETGLNREAIAYRLNMGWEAEKALIAPPRSQGNAK